MEVLSDAAAWREAAYVPVPDKPELVDLRPEAYAYVVIGSMVVDMGELNEKTADEWLLRLRAYEVIAGPMLHKHNPDTDEMEDVPVTMDALRPFFGTRVNVATVTRAKYRTKLGNIVLDRAKEIAWREWRDAEQATAAQ